MPMSRPSLAVLALLLALAGCGDGRPDSLDAPVVVVGIDGADWMWIDAVHEDRELPHFAALQERGARATLESLTPLQKSPVIWTTIATGKRPAKHGVGGFLERGGKPAGSGGRTAAAYWEVLGGLGEQVAVIGWWVTHPADPVNGAMVSDYVQYFSGPGDAAVADGVHPPSIAGLVDSLRVDPASLTLDDLARFVDVDSVRHHGQEALDLLEELEWILAGDESYRRIARALYERGDYDVFTVYFRGLDAVCHRYWRYMEPQHAPHLSQPWQQRLLGDLIFRYHEYTDELLGEVVSYVEPGSRVVVCSDHGWLGHRRTARGLTTGVDMHRKEGVLLLAGPGVREGIRFEGAAVADIMPTLLAMRGIPPARDLDGHLLGPAFVPAVSSWFDQLLPDAVPSYDAFRLQGGPASTGPEVDAEIVERLRSLGYID